jgi:hypothetical protein
MKSIKQQLRIIIDNYQLSITNNSFRLKQFKITLGMAFKFSLIQFRTPATKKNNKIMPRSVNSVAKEQEEKK